MEDILRPIYQERASLPNTLGIIIIEKRENAKSITDMFDAILLVIIKQSEEPIFVKHYANDDKKAAMHIISEEQLNQWLFSGTNRKIFEWIQNGKVVFDRNEYVQKLKHTLRDFPLSDRKTRMGIEFAKLIRRYVDGKTFFENQQFLDAYNHIIHSLHHLGRLSLIEKGFHPEVTVWNQVRQIEPEVFKLYHELVTSDETLEKRLELLFLVSEFLINDRIKIGACHILDLLQQKEQWSINEILQMPEIFLYSVDIEVLIEFLIEKKLIDVLYVPTKSPIIFHRYYKVK